MSRLLPTSLAHHRGALRPLALALHTIDMAAGWAIVVMMVVMVAIVSLQVVLRYALNSSLGFADELSRLTFVWAMFLAIPLGIRVGAHIGIEVVTARFPAPLRNLLTRVMAAIAAAMMLLVTWQAIVIAIDQWDELLASMNGSAAWFVVAVAVGCAHSAFHLTWITLTGRPEMNASVAAE